MTLSLFLLLSGISSHAFAQKTIYYVSEFGNQGSFAQSWADATNSVERAMFLAGPGDEIWVAGGNFALSQFSDNGLKLKEGVAMYGGFAGNETSLSQRDLKLRENESIINGDSKEYTIYNFQNNLTAATIFDGFTIKGGTRAGILNSSSSPTMSNLVVTGNGASASAEGGIINFQSSPSYINVKVIGNTGLTGVLNGQSQPVFVNCAIVNNAVFQANVSNDASSPVFINCTIAGETTSAVFASYGIYSQGNGSIKVYNSIVSGSFAPTFGFAEEDIQNSIVFGATTQVGSFIVLNPLSQIFVDPSAGDYRQIECSPAINNGSNSYFASGRTPDISSITTDLDGNPRFYNQGTVDIGAYEYQGDKPATPLRVWFVKEGGTGPGFGWSCAMGELEAAITAAQSGDQIWVAKGTYRPFFSSFAMKEGVKIYGGFDGTEQSFEERDLSITNNKSILSTNNAPVIANSYLNLTSAALLDGFTITGGTTGIANINSSPTLANLVITGNTSAGIANNSSSPVITNCAIVDNSLNASLSFGISNQNSSPVITNCTISGHNGTTINAGIYNDQASLPKVRNSIIFGNTNGIYNDTGNAGPTVENSIVENNPPAQGQPTPPSVDPLFVDAANKDYRLQPCSPAINAGFNYFQSGQTPDLSANIIDLAGVSVFSESAVDIGAYQFSGATRELAGNGEVAVANVSGNFVLTTSPGCKLLALVSPNGAAPLNGQVNAKVWVAGSQPVNFVKRHYQITPANNVAGATAKVTLYFTQQEFDDFNAVSATKLPLNAADAENYKSNLRIEKRAGVSSDDSGLPNSYSGAISTFKPSEANGNVLWNALTSRWEVSFDVTGFSGFFVKTIETALPLNLISFTATKEAGSNLLQWSTANEVNTDHFEIQSSADAKQFVKIATVNAGGSGNHRYSYADHTNHSGNIFYRLKMSDLDGSYTFSKIVSIAGNAEFAAVFPNPAQSVITFQVNKSLLKTTATLHDISGRKVQSIVVENSRQEVNVKSLPAGLYILKFADGSTQRFVKD